jgi:hypothetical protein
VARALLHYRCGSSADTRWWARSSVEAIAVGVAAWLIVRRTGSPGITLAVLIPAYC